MGISEDRITALRDLENGAKNKRGWAVERLTAIDALLFNDEFSNADFQRILKRTKGLTLAETTGLNVYNMMSQLMLLCRPKGKRVGPCCEVSTDSNAMARKLLASLRWQIFEPNTDENDVRLFVVGQLFDGVSRSVGNPNGAPSQEYQEFRLDRWYLVSPFKAAIEAESPQEFKIVSRTRLEKSDFKEEIDGLDSVINELHRSGI